MQQAEQFDQWALIELMGRQRIAGRVTEKTIAGAGFLQVDVPETKANPAFTRLIAPGSLYAINPVTEEVARFYAENLNVKPIESWDIQAFIRKTEERKLELQASSVPAYDSPDRPDSPEYDDEEEDHEYNN